MKCKQTAEFFDSYINGTINAADKQSLENHLEACESCRKQLELYRFYFSDVKIENDFPVPSQLNAKIKYTIEQARAAKATKKIPFWQSKRILSVATACAFLFVAGIWGGANYTKLQDAASTPVIETTNPITQGEPASVEEADRILSDSSVSAPVLAKQAGEAAQIPVQTEKTMPMLAAANPIPDVSNNQATYSAETNANLATDTVAGTEIETFHLTRNLQEPEDLAISLEWKEKILTHFPHEVISEDTFLITATKAELESFLECSLDADETKTQLTVQFVSAEE